MSDHPRQPLVLDEYGKVRFKENRIVVWMLEKGRAGERFDLNDIAEHDFSEEDMTQLAQLLGYSASGFCELSYVPDEDAEWAANEAERIMASRTKDPP